MRILIVTFLVFVDGNPMVRNGATGDWEGTFYGHKGAVWGVSWNSDATLAATGSADFTARIWSIENQGNEIHSFNHKHIVRAVDFSSDDKKLLTASNDKQIQMFDLTNYQSEPQLFHGHQAHIRDVYFISKDDNSFVSASEDKTVRFWDKRTGSSQSELRFDVMPYSVEVTADKNVLSICHGTKVSFYSLDKMSKLAEFNVPTEVYSASISPNKDTFVCGGEDFVIYKYDIQTQTQIGKFSLLKKFYCNFNLSLFQNNIKNISELYIV